MSVSALVLAAGGSERFGGSKLLTSLGGKPLLMHCIDEILDSDVEEVIVVTTGEILSFLKVPPDVRVVKNNDMKQGMSLSIRLGLKAVSESSDSVIVLLGDVPGITSSFINRILELHSDEPDKIIASLMDGKAMPPVLFPKKYFDDLKALHGDKGARDLIRNSVDLITIELDPDRHFDVDTSEDLDRAQDKF